MQGGALLWGASPPRCLMLAAKEMYDRQPIFARAEPDDDYEFPKPEPLDPWMLDEEEGVQRHDELDEEEDDE